MNIITISLGVKHEKQCQSGANHTLSQILLIYTNEYSSETYEYSFSLGRQ